MPPLTQTGIVGHGGLQMSPDKNHFCWMSKTQKMHMVLKNSQNAHE